MPRYTRALPKRSLDVLARGLTDGNYVLKVKDGRVRLVPLKQLQGLIEGPSETGEKATPTNAPAEAFSKEELTALCEKLRTTEMANQQEMKGKEQLYYKAAVTLLNEEPADMLAGRKICATGYCSGIKVLVWLHKDGKMHDLVESDEAFSAAANAYNWSIKKDKIDMCSLIGKLMFIFKERMFEEVKKQLKDSNLKITFVRRGILCQSILSFLENEKRFLQAADLLKSFVELLNSQYSTKPGESCQDKNERISILRALVGLGLKGEAAVEKAIEIAELVGNRTLGYPITFPNLKDALPSERWIQGEWIAVRLFYTGADNTLKWIRQNRDLKDLVHELVNTSIKSLGNYFNSIGTTDALNELKRSI